MRKARPFILPIAALACACGADRPSPRCVATATSVQVAVTNIDPIDVLFVVSDAPSMAAQQATLQRELPEIVRGLATGAIAGVEQAYPILDLHVAVVSASLADGVALHRAPASGASNGCDAVYPTFLKYHGAYYPPASDDASAFAQSFQCLAQVGAQASRPVEPLEAALRVLSNPIAIAGFSRNDPVQGLSLVTVVVVSDTDDCSPRNGAGASGQPPDTSAACAENGDALEAVDRYVQRLRSLRPGNENLVQLAIVGGIPAELTAPLSSPTFDWSVEAQRDAFYASVLDAPQMRIVPDPSAPDQLQPACRRGDAGAEPARRLTSAAQAFGENGIAVSICGNGWSTALARLLVPVSAAKRRGGLCLPRALTRGADGRVGCKMFWDLPPPELAEPGTPSRCSERPFLSSTGVAPSRPGGQRCEVAQVALSSEAALGAEDPAAGWYYDDFSQFAQRGCLGPAKVAIALTDFARPPSGVVVSIDCFALRQPIPGGAGAPSPAACFAGTPAPAGLNQIGTRCTPAAIPEGGFDEREVRVETGATDCGTGVCMVYKLRGDPRPECGTTPAGSFTESPRVCAAPEAVAERIYCSCRCRAPDPMLHTCACPQGFSCRDAIADGDPEFTGGYCVRNGT